jgi:hypothetical protein
MRYFILCLLVLSAFAGEADKPKPQPPEVLNALAAYEKGPLADFKNSMGQDSNLGIQSTFFASNFPHGKHGHSTSEIEKSSV